DNMLLELIRTSLQLPEMRHGLLESIQSPEAHTPVVMRWISGASFEDILETGKATALFAETDNLGAAVRYAADISTWLSWSFGAATSRLAATDFDVSDFARNLPLLVRHGVPNTAAACISLLGIADRTAAISLASSYLESGGPVSLERISDWINE